MRDKKQRVLGGQATVTASRWVAVGPGCLDRLHQAKWVPEGTGRQGSGLSFWSWPGARRGSSLWDLRGDSHRGSVALHPKPSETSRKPGKDWLGV